MTTLHGGLPSVKVEDASSMMIKDETMEDALSPYMEEDIYEDAGDLDFANAQKKVWLSHIPRSLWETLSTMEGDDEIEIGTLRVEGSESQPTRVSSSVCSALLNSLFDRTCSSAT
jgi:transcription initiation factor TFIIF subunit beta